MPHESPVFFESLLEGWESLLHPLLPFFCCNYRIQKSLSTFINFVMEVAGLTIGVVGVAGLYSTCIQLLGQIESSRTDYIARELHTLHARLCATTHLLKEWGQAIGLDSNGIPNPQIHNPKLADAEKRKVCLTSSLCICALKEYQ